MKVLIVDDSAIIRTRLIAMLSRIMRAEDISYAEDAPEAMNSIQKLNFDAVILDTRMPGGNGIDVLLEIKRNNQDLPVIVLADYPYRQYRRKYVDAGADFFFDKSTEFNQVMAALKHLSRIDADKTTNPRSRDDEIDSKRKGDKSK
ncbi:MAG: response regulator [Dehalococcoidia bacterium]|nr:response regulator [Dehalococcoidia bacterium]MDH4299101.1 response regulator [Dehalococcoidia bacterium]MDH4366780.1 response regulator [Dehalococcoidia bacterium]